MRSYALLHADHSAHGTLADLLAEKLGRFGEFVDEVLLHGVIDSPDIPLNVSRSYLQSDANVKKISTYITKKVADRLDEIFRNERQQLEEKWDNLKLFIEYGMLSDEKFCDRAMKFCLLKNTEGMTIPGTALSNTIKPYASGERGSCSSDHAAISASSGENGF